jgi:two-component system, OmpR family, sensor histidine kinase MprB
MLASAVAVAIAVVLGSVLTYVLTANELHGQVNAQLLHRVDNLRLSERHSRRRGDRLLDALGKRAAEEQLLENGPGNALRNLQPRPNQVRGYQQLVNAHGTVLFRSGAQDVTLPVDQRTRALAAGEGNSFFRDATVDGLHLRILAEYFAPGRVVQFAQPLGEVDHLLYRLRWLLGLLCLGGIALAALLAQVVARAAVLPVSRLTQTAEHVAETQDLSRRIAPTGEDEIGRLATSFNAMLDALERSMTALDASVSAQRQLVADASHELRTPVTSLRTNIEILQHADDLDAGDRERLLADVVDQIEELTALVNDLIDLARGEDRSAAFEDVRLDHVVQESLERTRRDTPTTPLRATLRPVIVSGVAARLERAVANLIDNAVKYSPPGEPVELTLQGGELTVRDHGPGIASEDLPHVFDRFYRGADARGRSGSGLGLAIVRQVVSEHGGTVAAEPAPGGGTLMRMRLPGADTLDETIAGVLTSAGENGGAHPSPYDRASA